MARIENYPDSETVRHAIQHSIKGDLNELNDEIRAATSGSGVLVSPSDTTLGYLIDKLTQGIGIRLEKVTPSVGNEHINIRALQEVVEAESLLGAGTIDGETRVVSNNGNRYSWDNTELKWRITTGNIYSVAPSATTYTIPLGTIIVIDGVPKIYNGLVFEPLSAELPVGAIVPISSGTVPARYLEADGDIVSRVSFATLFAAIGTAYGPGDGSTTFQLPDLRGTFLRGWDHGAGEDPDAGARTDRGDGTAGDNVGTRQIDEFKEHHHRYSHMRTLYGPDAQAGPDHRSVSTNTDDTGGSETRPKNVTVMYCIFTG